MKRLSRALMVALLAFSFSIGTPTEGTAQVIVDYTTSGTVGNWLLDFTVYNTFAPGIDQHTYLWGVMFGADLLSGSPTGWGDWPYGTNWSNVSWGGSSNVYDTNWFSSLSSPFNISPGESLGGFVANVPAVEAPTAVKWFAFTYGSTSASGDFHPGTNPGFEGTAFLESSTVPEPSTVREPSTVPEPSTVILLGTGLLGLGFMSWRRKEEED